VTLTQRVCLEPVLAGDGWELANDIEASAPRGSTLCCARRALPSTRDSVAQEPTECLSPALDPRRRVLS